MQQIYAFSISNQETILASIIKIWACWLVSLKEFLKRETQALIFSIISIF